MEREQGIIYDIGFFNGDDTDFYLKKGFKVIAIDANPLAIAAGEKRFAKYIEEKQLILLNVGIVAKITNSEKSEFYVNETLPEWSSFDSKIALRDEHPFHTVYVHCNTLSELIYEYGNAYYVKIDIEGHDVQALKSLTDSTARPKYISVENGDKLMLDMLCEMGYRYFKYVNQATVTETILPNPPLEGLFCEHRFESGSSGPFGEETVGSWKKTKEIRKIISKVWNLETGQKNPQHNDAIDGWFDLHAKYEG